MNENKLKEYKKIPPEFRDKVYARGFLVTGKRQNTFAFPILQNWAETEVCGYYFYTAKNQKVFIEKDDDYAIALIGHAYDPFRGISSEEKLISALLEQYNSKEKNRFRTLLNQLTGIFTIFLFDQDGIHIIGDPSCIQTTFYTVYQDTLYVSSHTDLLGILLDLEWDPYVKRLVGYRFFHLLGNSLPGDLTQFQEVKRLVPNHEVVIFQDKTIRVERFYLPHRLHVSDDEIVSAVADLMHKNLELISKKWKKPAISLTGGCDSKTTLACANGLYDRFSYFSYISSEAEKVDAEAAHTICKALNLSHIIYEIPEVDSAFPEIETVRKLLYQNTGRIRQSNVNDVRKRAFFADTKEFDVEVKSWVSEVGRAYYSKRFHGRTRFGSFPTPRKCTTLYKFFFHNRKLVRDTDKVFACYLKKYFRTAKTDPVEWQDQFFWEFRVPSWNGLVITGEHRYSFDITIPYNNRRILELLLSTSLDKRIHDNIYAKIREKMNPEIDRTGVAITNLLHTEDREQAENVYYILHSLFPF